MIPTQAWTYDPAGKDAKPEWKGWFRAKDAKGNFVKWTGTARGEGTTREATVYQAGWTVYYDVPGMIQLDGGKDLFVAKLRDFFERTPDFSTWSPYSGTPNPYHKRGQEPWWNSYNNPVNEPTELISLLFNRAGAPWLTQKWVRESMKVYLTGPEGMPGDDDCGQMSAWYVLAAIGLHQICAGDPRFEVFTPHVRQGHAHARPEIYEGRHLHNHDEKSSRPTTSTSSPRLSMASRSTDAG